MHKALNNQLRPYGTHPYYQSARQGQVAEHARLHAVKAIVNNFQNCLIPLRVAMNQLRAQGCFEAELSDVLNGEKS